MNLAVPGVMVELMRRNHHTSHWVVIPFVVLWMVLLSWMVTMAALVVIGMVMIKVVIRLVMMRPILVFLLRFFSIVFDLVVQNSPTYGFIRVTIHRTLTLAFLGALGVLRACPGYTTGPETRAFLTRLTSLLLLVLDSSVLEPNLHLKRDKENTLFFPGFAVLSKK